ELGPDGTPRLGGGAGERLLLDVHADHPRAVLGEPQRGRPAHPAGRTGHDDDLPVHARMMTHPVAGDESLTRGPHPPRPMAAEHPTAPADPVTATTTAEPAPAAPDGDAPAEQGGAPLVDIEKDAVSPELEAKGSRPWTKSERQLLTEWTARITAAQHAHYYLMTLLRRRNLMLGIPVIVLTATLG